MWYLLIGFWFLWSAPNTASGNGLGGTSKIVDLIGTLVPGGVECQLFQTDSEERYILIGDLKGFSYGDRVKISGETVWGSICMQGKTLAIKKIEWVDSQEHLSQKQRLD